MYCCLCLFFFFQAEDGIRDWSVTGVQTCALPICGLSRAVVVIEASEKSGSLITARLALDQGRDVLAVPGNVLSGRNRGAHALLRDGAKIVEDADDILEELGMCRRGATAEKRGTVPLSDPVLASLVPG